MSGRGVMESRSEGKLEFRYKNIQKEDFISLETVKIVSSFVQRYKGIKLPSIFLHKLALSIEKDENDKL